jgi:hypothetical protein
MSSRRPGFVFTWFLTLLLAVFGAISNGQVLCIEGDGRVAVEHRHLQGECPGSHSEDTEPTPTETCVDIEISSDQTIVGKVASIEAPAFYPLIGVMHAICLAPQQLPGIDLGAIPKRPAALRPLSTIILLV